MLETAIGILAIPLFLLLVALGTPVGFAFAFVGIVGIWIISGIDPAMVVAGVTPFSTVHAYAFTVIPLFIFMGQLLYRSGYADALMTVAQNWVGHIRGGLGISTALAGTGFAMVSGSSIASVSVFGKMAGPRMERAGYHPPFAYAIIGTTGVLASIIPPSVLVVVYAMLARKSIGVLLMAAYIPGFIQAAVVAGVIYIRTRINPRLAPPIAKIPLRERVFSSRAIWGPSLVAFTIFGGIYFGVFTPTEAAAVAVLVSSILFVLGRGLNGKELLACCADTVRITAMIFIIIIGGMIFSRLLALTRISYEITGMLVSVDIEPTFILIGILLLYLFLGCFLDGTSIMVLTLPIFLPWVEAAGINSIWFGILVCVTIELGMITPPLGLNIFVLGGIAPHVRIEAIFKNILWFFLALVLVLALLVAVPQLVLFLPNRMM